ncbi:AAA family ATPase [Pseudomonas prosekii]|uniref:AAA family ATPase n=1 Tax=Pseudomonas prosekii TaxID=1148509 RepID=UPI001CA404F4|nr:AAA family ATPase [Pseudomonas prosekii]
MSLTFVKLSLRGSFSQRAFNTAVLLPDNWDDYGYKTSFSLTVYDGEGAALLVGNVKIAYIGQVEGWSEDKVPDSFNRLSDDFYSLGQDADYYQNLVNNLNPLVMHEILEALGDVAYLPQRLHRAAQEKVFTSSLLRVVNHTTIVHQFTKILRGEAPLTPYDFYYVKPPTDRSAGLRLDFSVKPDSKPSSNMHILIGRNGVGKTTILNSMIEALVSPSQENFINGHFFKVHPWHTDSLIQQDEFAGVVSVSFSAFDPFEPPPNQSDASAGMRYRYIGLKKKIGGNELWSWGLKTKDDLCTDLANSLSSCLALQAKRFRWVNAIKKLESDYNFEEMNLLQLIDAYEADWSDSKDQFLTSSSKFFDRMSSGHAIVLLTITQLIETVEERTLVLIDEPESHLHPPLLSAFTRALSDLLTNRNAVAIIATHSPVVLQEVPKSCVSVISRTRLVATVDSPESETFAENVGALTRQVFGLEVNKSGFHELLALAVSNGMSFEEIEQQYSGQIGNEGQALLRSLTISRDRNWESNK